MAKAYDPDLDTHERDKLRKALRTKFGEGGLWNPASNTTNAPTEWTAAQNRRLQGLLNEHPDGHNYPWSEWVRLFRPHTVSQLRAYGRKLSDRAPSLRCAYGFDTTSRCKNTRANAKQLGLTFQKVPNQPLILRHMSISKSKWSEHMSVCSDHGHDPHQALSVTNIPSSTSNSNKKKRPAALVGNLPPLKRVNLKSTPTKPTREEAMAARRAQAEKEYMERTKERTKKREEKQVDDLLDDKRRQLNVDNDQELAKTIFLELVTSQQETEKCRRRYDQLVKQSQAERDLLRAIRPDSWDDVDSDWVASELGFGDKVISTTFWDAFILPRIDRIEGYQNYVNHQVVKNPIKDLTGDISASDLDFVLDASVQQSSPGANLILVDTESPDDVSHPNDPNNPSNPNHAKHPSDEYAMPCFCGGEIWICCPTCMEPLCYDHSYGTCRNQANPNNPNNPAKTLRKMKKKMTASLERDKLFRVISSGKKQVLPMRKPKKSRHRYKPSACGNIQLNYFQEFVIYMQFIRQGMDKGQLAMKWFGRKGRNEMARIRSIICTWAAFLFEVLKAEDWWLYPASLNFLKSKTFDCDEGEDVLSVADCTNMNCENSEVSELIRQQLYSMYYKHTCGKFCVAMSRVGGCVAVSPGMGGPANDHECMAAAGLFDPEKWKVEPGESPKKLLYDAGVTHETKTAARKAGFLLITSGDKRKSAKSKFSYQRRWRKYRVSTLRIRVENMIGIVKQKFKILQHVLPIADIGMMDKIVFTCFMLHNFGFQTVA